MKRFLLRALLTSLVALTASAPALAAKKTDEAEPSVASVNGKAIPKSRADALMAEALGQGQQDSEQLRNAVRDELIKREILAQEAQKKGIDKKSEVKTQLELVRQSVLINLYMQDYMRGHPISDEALKKEYEMVKAQMGDKEYKTRHILVDKEDEAKDIVARLKKGEKFDDLAKQSKDPGSKDKGGDLGWAPPSQYVRPFSDAMVKLEKGKYTETPVKSDYGYHVIMLDDTRELKLPSLEEAKPQLVQRLQQQTALQHITELRRKAKVD